MRTPASSEPGADGKYIVVKFGDEKNGCIWLFDFECPAPTTGWCLTFQYCLTSTSVHLLHFADFFFVAIMLSDKTV